MSIWDWERGFPFTQPVPIWRQQEEVRDPETFQVSQVVPHSPAQTGWMIFEKAKSRVLTEEAYCPAREERPSWWREDFRQGWMDE